jgi:hypothetical protein
MKKFYLFLSVVLALSGRQAVLAQDSSVCNAAFQATVVGNVVNFRAMDSMPGARHNWNFGDGDTRSTDSFVVSHTYSAYGNYLVTQVVIDSTHHCRDSSSQLVTVSNPGSSCNVYINFTSDSVHHIYSFLAIPVFSGGSNVTITWTINDTLAGSGDTLTRYLPYGPYTVCANLRIDSSCSSQACVTINPQDSLPPPPPDTCTIAFTAAPKDHKSNQYVFTVIDGKEYDSISWTIMGPDSLFAGPYHGPSFSYTFPDTGYYAVYVSAEKRSGCLVSNGEYVQIDSVPGPSGHYINSYPNPATTQVTLSVRLEEYTKLDIRVYNSMGGQVLSRSVTGYPGGNQITLPIANLPMGVYYIEVQFGDTILRSKFQKL